MKDLFMPVILAVLVILAGGFFILKIYTPQKQTVTALTDSSRQAEISLLSELDGNGEKFTGASVKSVFEQYGEDVVSVYSSKSNKISDDDVDDIDDDELYIKTVIRNEEKEVKSIKFVKE